MLHVVNGDETARRLAPVALAGELLVWRDILVEGPVAPGLEGDPLAVARAPWLARRLGIRAEEYLAGARAHMAGLARAAESDELVLWFEQDLFCVANLAYLAAWIVRTPPRGRVCLVFPAEPLGTADAATLLALFEGRRPLDGAAIAAAAEWWAGFTASDPRHFAPAGETLPFLGRARALHLARFPATGTGLGSVEAAALATLSETPRRFADVFRDTMADERMRGHGMGDVQLAAYLDALSTGPAPLVTITGDERRFALTATGRAVREGARDRLDAQTMDWWLGGVHLQGRHSAWRWHQRTGGLISA